MVSRTGDAGRNQRGVKVPECTLIKGVLVHLNDKKSESAKEFVTIHELALKNVWPSSVLPKPHRWNRRYARYVNEALGATV
jgi:hypothetical protein